MNESFASKRKLHHKTVKEVSGGRASQKDRVRNDENLLTKNYEIVLRWKEYFQELLPLGRDEKAKVSCWGKNREGKRVMEQKDATRKEVRRVTVKLKIGKSPGIGGIRNEWLTYRATVKDVDKPIRRLIMEKVYGKGTR